MHKLRNKIELKDSRKIFEIDATNKSLFLEHRNMPIEDALILITRNFDAYMRGEKMIITSSGPMSVTDRHPEAMQMLINLLAENRQLTVAQYDKLFKYLQERRDLQVLYEGGDISDVLIQPEGGKAAELQNRILNILNKSNDDSQKTPAVPVSILNSNSNEATTPAPLLNDPSVQKALDSLLSGDMFKSISTGF